MRDLSNTTFTPKGKGSEEAGIWSPPRDTVGLSLAPDRAILKTGDLDQISAEMTRAISSHVAKPQPGVKRIEAAKAEATLGELGLIQIGYGADVSIKADSCGPHFLVQVPLSGTALIGTGKNAVESDTRTATIVRPDDPLHFRLSHDLQLLMLRVPASSLEAHCAQLLGDRGLHLERPLDFVTGFALDNDAGQSWLRMMKYIRDEAVGGNGSFLRQSPLALASLNQMLMNTLLTMQRHNYSDLLQGPAPAAAPFYVRKAEEFMRAHVAEPITLPQVAAAAGISVRALSRGFQDFRSTSPMAWLKGIRLERVRDSLLTCDPNGTSISAIALEWGFDHLGHFGQAFRNRFGETPRDTLRRQR